MKQPVAVYTAILITAAAMMIWVCWSVPLTPLKDVLAFSLVVLPWLLIPIVGPLATRWRRRHSVIEEVAPQNREIELGWTVSIVIILAFIALFLGMILIGHR